MNKRECLCFIIYFFRDFCTHTHQRKKMIIINFFRRLLYTEIWLGGGFSPRAFAAFVFGFGELCESVSP